MAGGSGMQHSHGGETSLSFAERVERKRVERMNATGTIEKPVPKAIQDKIALRPYRDAIIKALLGCEDLPGYQAAFGHKAPRVQIVEGKDACYDDVGYSCEGIKQVDNAAEKVFLQVTAGQSGTSNQLMLNVDPATTISTAIVIRGKGAENTAASPGFACTLRQLAKAREATSQAGRDEYDCPGFEVFPAAAPEQVAARVADAIAEVTLACTPAEEPASAFGR